MRDKLIGLIFDSAKLWRYPVGNGYLFDYGKLADHLIANGVTFAEDNNVPCKYCNEYADLPEHFVDGKPVGRVFDTCIQCDDVSWHLEPASGTDIGIKYCPMCGRLLPEPPKGKV